MDNDEFAKYATDEEYLAYCLTIFAHQVNGAIDKAEAYTILLDFVHDLSNTEFTEADAELYGKLVASTGWLNKGTPVH